MNVTNVVLLRTMLDEVLTFYLTTGQSTARHVNLPVQSVWLPRQPVFAITT